MSSSIRELVHLTEAEAAFAASSPVRVDDAVHALHHLGRAIRTLATDGLDSGRGMVRGRLAQCLADACTETAVQAGAGRAARTSACAGALADLICRTSGELTADQRWALVATLAATTRRITLYTAEDAPIQGRAARVAAYAVCARVESDPPSPAHYASLDRSVPTINQPRGVAPIAAASEALLVIAHHLRVTVEHRRPAPTLVELFAVTRAAESTAARALAAITAITGVPAPAVHIATAAWRLARTRLQPFASNTLSPNGTDDLSAWALHTHIGLRQTLDDDGTHPQPPALRHLQRMTNLLPDISDHLCASLRGLADAGDLHAPAHRLPFRECRLTEHLAKSFVIADATDLCAAQTALQIAGDHAAQLALDLNTSLGVQSEQPGYSLRMRSEPDTPADAADRSRYGRRWSTRAHPPR